MTVFTTDLDAVDLPVKAPSLSTRQNRIGFNRINVVMHGAAESAAVLANVSWRRGDLALAVSTLTDGIDLGSHKASSCQVAPVTSARVALAGLAAAPGAAIPGPPAREDEVATLAMPAFAIGAHHGADAVGHEWRGGARDMGVRVRSKRRRGGWRWADWKRIQMLVCIYKM
ncbi:hypothetical protein HDU93_007476 [Gonapodya sp. JEL0774]|nr:hypothetical protein HDU93_007476 [Gonapodya sp. JEL0774]